MRKIIIEKESSCELHRLKPGQFFKLRKNPTQVYLLVAGRGISNKGDCSAMLYVDADQFETQDTYSPPGAIILFEPNQPVQLLEMVEPPTFRVV